MADYVYLLETRLSASQAIALAAVRDVARLHGLTVFLVGGAVRDLISGSPVRDLDFVVQGDAQGLGAALERTGAIRSGESKAQRSLFLRFPSGVRVEVGPALTVTYDKPGKPTYTPTSILDDLRRRDFTANAMALSLNEGSYGLLMDPLNGVADIENRELRLVSPYGFLEDPVRMIRAARFMARQGWRMDERTQARYETGRQENYIAAMRAPERGYELEELFHEEEPLRVMRRLEEEGWLQFLSPALSTAKANTVELAKLRESQMQLQTRGVLADAAAANFPLLTAKLSAAETNELKASFPRSGFVREIESLEAEAKEFGARLLSKELATPSAAFKAIMAAHPAAVLWLAYSSRSAALQARLKSFVNEWPLAQTKIPYLLMAEMRITPEVPGYQTLLEEVVFALMDERLETPEAMRSFLEPYSPPAPPPPVSLRRQRAPRKEAKSSKARKKQADVIADVTKEAVTPEASTTPAQPPTSAASEVSQTSPGKKAPPPAKAAPEKQVGTKSPAKATKATESAAEKSAAKPVAGTAPPKLGSGAAKVVPPPVKAAPMKAAPGKAKTAAPPVKGATAKARPAAAAPASRTSAGKRAKAAKQAPQVGKKTTKKPPVKAAPVKATPAKTQPKVVRSSPARKLSGLTKARAASKGAAPRPKKKAAVSPKPAARKPAAKPSPASKKTAKKTVKKSSSR